MIIPQRLSCIFETIHYHFRKVWRLRAFPHSTCLAYTEDFRHAGHVPPEVPVLCSSPVPRARRVGCHGRSCGKGCGFEGRVVLQHSQPTSQTTLGTLSRRWLLLPSARPAETQSCSTTPVLGRCRQDPSPSHSPRMPEITALRPLCLLQHQPCPELSRTHLS